MGMGTRSGMAERIERGQIDNFTVQQLRSYISNNRQSKHALTEYAMKVLMERIQLPGFTRRRLPSQVTMGTRSGMAERIERGQIDRFTVPQLKSYLKPSNVHNKHAKYAYKVLMERLKPAGFARRRMGANDEQDRMMRFDAEYAKCPSIDELWEKAHSLADFGIDFRKKCARCEGKTWVCKKPMDQGTGVCKPHSPEHVGKWHTRCPNDCAH